MGQAGCQTRITKLLCKGTWKESVCSFKIRCLRTGFDTARDSKKGRKP